MKRKAEKPDEVESMASAIRSIPRMMTLGLDAIKYIVSFSLREESLLPDQKQEAFCHPDNLGIYQQVLSKLKGFRTEDVLDRISKRVANLIDARRRRPLSKDGKFSDCSIRLEIFAELVSAKLSVLQRGGNPTFITG
jgi:hypothetical protein